MGGEVQHAIVVPELVLRAVTVVHVPVHHQHARRWRTPQDLAHGDSHVGKNAEPVPGTMHTRIRRETSERTNEQASERASERANGLTEGRVSKQTNERKGGNTHDAKPSTTTAATTTAATATTTKTPHIHTTSLLTEGRIRSGDQEGE